MYTVAAISTAKGNCRTGESRLGAAIESSELMTREGRVEICVNNAWGTVCEENSLFDGNDAAVFCDQLVGFSSAGIQISLLLFKNHSILAGAHILENHAYNSANESSPIFLSALTCEGTEENILDCERRQHKPIGLHSCDHSQDVAVQCSGEYSSRVDRQHFFIPVCRHQRMFPREWWLSPLLFQCYWQLLLQLFLWV